MLFNSFGFAIFLPIVFCAYWVLPHRFRWVVLLVSSYYFYMSWNPKYVVLILFTTCISYFSALLMELISPRKRKIYLFLTIAVCLGVLFVFKYYNFFCQNLQTVFGFLSIKLHPATLEIMLPVGISFYTFQTLSYVIDVYKGDVDPERHFGKYATFISFFPQLVAGPIERTKNLLPQICAEHHFEYDKASYGLKLMAWGFFKKMVIADTVALGVDAIYNDVRAYTGGALIVATVLFAIQIYCDFSGYSDIAIGTAKLFGIDLMTNFKTPYFSQTIKEFWGRWHISLSTWFRDYVYIPLGGNRVSVIRHRINLILTFLVSGLWHGANWTYVIWGGLHGVYEVAENILGSRINIFNKNWLKPVKIFIVFFLCCFAWLFFRANSVSDALYIIKHVSGGVLNPIQYIKDCVFAFSAPFAYINRSFFVVCLLVFIIYEIVSLKKDCIELISKKPLLFRWLMYSAIVLIVIFYTPVETNSVFIYFQF